MAAKTPSTNRPTAIWKGLVAKEVAMHARPSRRRRRHHAFALQRSASQPAGSEKTPKATKPGVRVGNESA